MISRQTKQKQVLEQATNKFQSFFNAEQLQQKVENISLATIYRYLKEQTKQGKLFSYQCDGKTIYSTKRRSHCHFICEETGKVIHFDIDSLDFLKNKIPGTIESFQIEIRGVCNTCSNKSAK